MELYKVPNHKWVRVLAMEDPPPGGRFIDAGEVVYFSHIDGMYSYCKDKAGDVVYLRAWTDVEVVEDEE